MRVLLDETSSSAAPEPDRLRLITAQFVGWSGMKNGNLLRAAETAGFEVLITSDQNLAYQQNLNERSIGVVTLDPAEMGNTE